MKARLLFLAGVALAFSTGCGPEYEAHRVTDVRASAGGQLNEATMDVTLPLGAILTASVLPYDTDEEIMESSDVTTDDGNVLEVLHVANAGEDKLAFVGRHAGETTVRYFVDGRQIRSARALVTPP